MRTHSNPEESPYYATEQDHEKAFIKYWKERGINVGTKIEETSMRHFTSYNLRSDLVMRVPRAPHPRVYGIDRTEIKLRHQRKWG
jgi:hypothetical protein